jgi:hypothetical protein
MLYRVTMLVDNYVHACKKEINERNGSAAYM